MRRFTPLAGICLVLGLACYTDDVGGPGPNGKPAAPVIRVNITDDPFPFDSVQSVNVYIVSVEATTTFDTSGGSSSWVTLAAPHQAVNLLNYQNGALAFLGQDSASAGQYKSVRMTIDADSSSIILPGGAHASVNWSVTGRVTLYAFVSPALTIDSASDLVIDFDVGRSFLYNLFGTREFTFIPVLRAVNSAQTGSIQGTVTTSFYGGSQPVANADVTVYPGNQTAVVLATGRTDAAGHYRVSYLPTGSYTISVTQPIQPGLATVTINNLTVPVGGTVTQDVTLPAASVGTPGIHVTGQNYVGISGIITLLASVTDSLGRPVQNPTVTWTSSDTTIAGTIGHGAIDSTYGKAVGTAVIRATSGVYTDSLVVQVADSGSLAPVNSVQLSPDSLNLPISVDSLGFYALLYSADHTELYNRQVAWFVSDTTVVRLTAFGQTAILQPLKVGTATVQATSEGKSGTAKVTIH